MSDDPGRLLPIRRILCPIDFQGAAEESLKTASELAERFDAELLLVHVISPVPMPIPPPMGGAPVANHDIARYEKELEESYARELKRLADRLVGDRVRTRTMVAVGDASGEIARLAGEEDADLLVIATHGRTGLKRFFLGSTTEAVVRTAECPVLTLRHPGEDEGED